MDPGGRSPPLQPRRGASRGDFPARARVRNGWPRRKPGVAFAPPVSIRRSGSINTRRTAAATFSPLTLPAWCPDVWKPGQAKLIKAGTDLVFQMHYTANGNRRSGSDLDRPGVREGASEGEDHLGERSPTACSRFPRATGIFGRGHVTVRTPMTMVSLFPHMHLRGKAFQYDVIYPGRPQRDHSQSRQMESELATFLHAGRASALPVRHANQGRPPGGTIPPIILPIRTRRRTSAWGEQSWEEMLVGFMNVAVDPGPVARPPALAALE